MSRLGVYEWSMIDVLRASLIGVMINFQWWWYIIFILLYWKVLRRVGDMVKDFDIELT